MLEAVGIVLRYGDHTALDGVSLSVGAGEFVSVVGPNGAGKTSLVGVLTGLLRPTTGTVRFKGTDIAGVGPRRTARLGLARSFQLVAVFPQLSVADGLCIAVAARLGRARRPLRALTRDRQVEAEARDTAGLFGLAAQWEVPAAQLSQGDKKLLDVASAFALRPELILLDEPTSGVSTADKHAVMGTVIGASERLGVRTILAVEHDMDLVFAYSDRIVALHDGKVLADGTPETIRADPAVMATVIGQVGAGPGRRPAC